MTEIHDPFDEVSQLHLGVTDTDGIGETEVEMRDAVGTYVVDKVHFIPITEWYVAAVGMVAVETDGPFDEMPGDVMFLPIHVADASAVSVRWTIDDTNELTVLSNVDEHA